MKLPLRGSFRPSPAGGIILGHLFSDEPTPAETPVLVLPLTRDGVLPLYERLGRLFGGSAARAALEAVGVPSRLLTPDLIPATTPGKE